MRRPRRNHSAALKAKVPVAALRGGDKTLAELAGEFDIHANQIVQWRAQLIEAATDIFPPRIMSYKPRARPQSEKAISFTWLYPALVLALLLPSDCYAYIDPNAGGWLFQMLFPVLVAIGGVWSIFWRRIGALWDRIFRRTDRHE